ncbi:MAG: phosphohydrolase, partial [Cyanobacteria bacterium J06621_12]
KTSLELQGGIFSPAEAKEFISQPYSSDAVKLRIWDDLAKMKGLRTSNLEYFIPVVEESIIE